MSEPLTLDTAPVGSIVTIGHPANGSTARKMMNHRWFYTDRVAEVEYDDLHKTAQLVYAPGHGPEGEVKALVTIEATERLVKRALRALDGTGDPDNGEPGENLRWARLLLTQAVDVTTARTCTAVKTQHLSDEISLKADDIVAKEVKIARRVQASEQGREVTG